MDFYVVSILSKHLTSIVCICIKITIRLLKHDFTFTQYAVQYNNKYIYTHMITPFLT